MNKIFAAVLCVIVTFMMTPTAFSMSLPEYEASLSRHRIELSANPDAGQVRAWLRDPNSGYPALADGLIGLLNGSRPKGNNTTVLDGIMGEVKVVHGKDRDYYLPPPYDIESIRKAYVYNWKGRNSGEWQSLSKEITSDYKKAFSHIVGQ
jgi:hypothetical protein